MPWILPERERISAAGKAPGPVLGSVTALNGEISCSVSWQDEASGTVQWKLENHSKNIQQLVILRNNYMFGGAFWPVYVANSFGRGASGTNPSDNFGVNWINTSTNSTPLKNLGVSRNTMPIGLVTKQGSSGTINASNSSVVFIFTLGPGEVYPVIEGGFSASMLPQLQKVLVVKNIYCGDVCAGYDQQRVKDWDSQTGTTLKGYAPDPGTVLTCAYEIPASDPYMTLNYTDSFSTGKC